MEALLLVLYISESSGSTNTGSVRNRKDLRHGEHVPCSSRFERIMENIYSSSFPQTREVIFQSLLKTILEINYFYILLSSHQLNILFKSEHQPCMCQVMGPSNWDILIFSLRKNGSKITSWPLNSIIVHGLVSKFPCYRKNHNDDTSHGSDLKSLFEVQHIVLSLSAQTVSFLCFFHFFLKREFPLSNKFTSKKVWPAIE